MHVGISMKFQLLLYFVLCSCVVFGQNATVYGTISARNDNEAVEFVSVFIEELSISVQSDDNGKFELSLPANTPVKIQFRRTGFKHASYNLPALNAGRRFQLNISLASDATTDEVIITADRIDDAGMVKEKVEALKLLPSTTGNLESILPHIALGTSSGTGGELTSQYNVRGGNYDENLVYVNDFEINRPLLVRTGNQEGLSLPNLDLIRDLSFSSGSFEAKYGDKMSSVLDVRYKLPDSLRGSFSVSFLGATGHLEGSLPAGKDPYKRWRVLMGVRYKTTQYLLGSLDVKGEYSPSFMDYQVYTTYDLSRSWQIGVLANLNRSKYDFIPESSQTASGLINFALRLTTD